MKHISYLIFFVMILCGCSSHFISDECFRNQVAEDFSSRSEILRSASIDIESMDVDVDEKEALMFLYAYMPLGDLVNHGPEFYLDHYRMTGRAVREMPWGKSVPERELRHFVLPVRVNNENLDSSRYAFYEELAPRVRELSMYDAVLEVNHWCHEKAVYMPSDRRTSSPMATVRTAYGRCGEESTLLVAALRSVGIPARQVYTPRWAHTDSNHAWVEAWVDGKWYFLGACEPEPVLNLGWFNAPASRGLLMHTNVFGKYDGPEEKVRQTPNFTEINVIGNYAPRSASLDVVVKDVHGIPIEGADVHFKIYNYSEFCSVAYKVTDSLGRASLTVGHGDMMVYASRDGKFGFARMRGGNPEAQTIVLEYAEGSAIPHMEMEVVPPVEDVSLPEVTSAQREENTCRMEYEDSLRNAYVAGFYDFDGGVAFALQHGLDPEMTAKVLTASRGNHMEVAALLEDAASKGAGTRALELLLSVAEKDLRDTPAHVFADHLYNTPSDADVEKVLCPRVSYELLTPYRSYLQEAVPESLADSVRRDPALLADWCNENISLHDGQSLRYVELQPQRVWETRLADRNSRDIFFVAMCRSFNVPAWKDKVTGTIKYEKDSLVYDVDFDAGLQTVAPKGYVKFRYDEIPLLDDPKYKVHFTLSRFEDGFFKLLEYGGGTLKGLFGERTELDCGYYMLVSGSRMSGGNVFTDIEFFTVDRGRTTVVDLVMRDVEDQIRVIGSFDSEMKYLSVPSSPEGEKVVKSVLETTGRGYFAVALVDYGTEPTNHAFMDISSAAAELEEWGRPLLVVFATEEDYRKFRAEQFALPSTVHYGIDMDGRMRSMIASEMKLDKGGRLPLVVLADTFNRVVFFSQGYNIGLGDSLVRTSKAL